MKIIGQEGVDDIREAALEAAKDDSDSCEGEVTFNGPSLSSVELLKAGDEVIAYKFVAPCYWEPQDNDILVDSGIFIG